MTPLNNNSNVQTQMYKHSEWKQALVPLFFVGDKKKTCFRVVYFFYGLAMTTAIRWMKIVGEHEFIFLPGPSVHYMCSQYLADSSLSEDVSQYDFSTPIQVNYTHLNLPCWVVKIVVNCARSVVFLLLTCGYFVGLFCVWTNTCSIQTW